MNAAIAWLLTFMVAVAPTNRKQFHEEAKETPEQAEERYHSIAEDITTVLWSNPSLFAGVDGRLKTASVVASIMFKEGSFRRDVDLGLGGAARGDGGSSWCLMQVKAGSGRTGTWNTAKHRFRQWGDPEGDLVQGWTGEELVQDRKKCIEAGYRIMSTSFSMCRKLPVEAWLRAYASGNCEDDGGGAEKSVDRMKIAINWFNRHPPGIHDADIILPDLNPSPPAPQSILSGLD